jgi:predicted dehydrogenase
MIRIAVIGYGYWGPRIARNFHDAEDCQLVLICDQRPELQRRAQQAYPTVRVTGDSREAIKATDVDAVAIVTPVWTHFDLAKAALENGKHVFVEKPFTATAAQAEELIDLADRKHLQIMVDHTFLFTGAVKHIRRMIDEGTLGRLYYYDSTRVNLGLFQHDINVVWDLAPHDLSIMDYLIKEQPDTIIATGQVHLNGFEDIAYITIYFANRMIAHINVNWLSPVKVRTTLLGGEKKMWYEMTWKLMKTSEYTIRVCMSRTGRAFMTYWSVTGPVTCGRRRLTSPRP